MTEKAFIKETNAYGRLCNYTFKVLGVNYVVRKIKRLSFISQDVWFRGGGGCHMNHCPLIIEGGEAMSPPGAAHRWLQPHYIRGSQPLADVGPRGRSPERPVNLEAEH